MAGGLDRQGVVGPHCFKANQGKKPRLMAGLHDAF